MEDKDILYQLFAGMPDEMLPENFNEKVMRKVMVESAFRVKKRKYREFFWYASGIIAMLTIGVFILIFYEISIEVPQLELPVWTFPKPDYELFKSQSFHLSIWIGIVALFLLIVDSIIRRNIEKSKNQQHEADF